MQAAAASGGAGQLFTGTSGWAYPSWKPGFYPATQPARRFLEYYAEVLNAVEVNYTFRKLPKPAAMEAWLAATPAGFRFCFKAPQGITHFKRLRECDAAVEEFIAHLEPFRRAGKLGLLLFQLPPNFKADPTRLSTFLEGAAFRCRDTAVAFEFRHASWFTEETYGILRARGAALCLAESENLVTPEVTTASFACYRLRRPGGYSRARIVALARRLTEASRERDVFAFFKHEDEPRGALNAVALRRRVRAEAARA